MAEIVTGTSRKDSDPKSTLEENDSLYSSFTDPKILRIIEELKKPFSDSNKEKIVFTPFLIIEDLDKNRLFLECDGAGGHGISLENKSIVYKSEPRKASITKDEAGSILQIYSLIEQIIDFITAVYVGAFSSENSDITLTLETCYGLSSERKIKLLKKRNVISKSQSKELDKMRVFRNKVSHTANSLQISYDESFYDIMHRFTVDADKIKEELLLIYKKRQNEVIDRIHKIATDGYKG